MAEAGFEGVTFAAALTTRVLGRTLVARARTGSTNDLAWEGLARGLPDGTVFVADEQTRGRGRAGRAWVAPPGRGLLLSIALRLGREWEGAWAAPRAEGSASGESAPGAEPGLLPLVAGLALAQGLERCGAEVELKWPNDVLMEGRKLAGVLCETRVLAGGDRVAVIGVGVNVLQRAEEFPAELRERAASLALAGLSVSRERAAAEFLNALEPLVDDYRQRGGAERARERYRRRASFWGQAVAVRAAGRVLRGVARDLDAGGGLVLRLEDGREAVAVAGDVDLVPEGDQT